MAIATFVVQSQCTIQHRVKQLMGARSGILLLWYLITVVAAQHLACLSYPPPSTRYRYDYLFTYIHESFPLRQTYAKAATQTPRPGQILLFSPGPYR
ncbi:hypothetical protein B0T13DRAFT_200137 [Neurospora crassa]|nr:hypothetical protein B0T13DRAFT_200137 [Neurospora crassa]